MQFLDYDPTTGIDTLIIGTTDISPAGVKHSQSVKWTLHTESLSLSQTIPIGHLLHIAVTVTLASGNPGAFGQLLYNGPSGASTVGLLPANSALVWPFGSPIACPDATITFSSSAVAPNSTGNTASVAAIAGATYSWTILNGTITSGQGTSQITWSAGASGPVILGVIVTKGASSSGSATVSVNALTTMTLSSSGTPSLPGQPVTFTAAVNAVAPGTGLPGGSVQFLVDGLAFGTPVNLIDGVAELSSSSLTHGAHTITAQYAGDSNCFGTTNYLSQSEIINTPPRAGNYSLSAVQDATASFPISSLLAASSDPDGDALSLGAVSPGSAQGGTITLVGGIVTYTPPAGYVGTDTFTYTITDPFGGTATASATVSVATSHPQDPPLLSIDRLADNTIYLTCSGVPGQNYLVEATTNLVTPIWTTLTTTNAGLAGLFNLIDRDATNYPARFYRAVTH